MGIGLCNGNAADALPGADVGCQMRNHSNAVTVLRVATYNRKGGDSSSFTILYIASSVDLLSILLAMFHVARPTYVQDLIPRCCIYVWCKLYR